MAFAFKNSLIKYSRHSINFLVLCILISSLWMPYTQSLATRMRNNSYDFYQRLLPRTYVDAPVKIVEIDNASLEKIGQFPWSRLRFAELVTKLEHLGAKVIAFDMLFSEPDRTAPKQLINLFADYPKLQQQLLKVPDNDVLFAQTIQKSAVVTSFMLKKFSNQHQLPTPKAGIIIRGEVPFNQLNCLQTDTIHSLDIFETAAQGNGSVAYFTDEDGVIRNIPLFICLHDNFSPNHYRLAPSLSLEAVRLFKQQQNYQINSDLNTSIESIQMGSQLKIQTSANAHLWLHYTPTHGSRYIPAWKILSNQVPKQDIAGKIIFIGVTANNLLDLRFSPFGYSIPGVEIHAQASEQMLQNTYLETLRFETLWDSIFLITIACLFHFFSQKINGLALFSLLIALVITILSLGTFTFLHWRVFIDPIIPIVFSMVLFSVDFIQKQLQTEAEKRWLRIAFGRYISPNRVKHLIEHPDSLTLGGEYRECSFVMTDLADFTTLMEQHPPHECVSLLNNYLDGMIQIAFQHQGTLDRIVGDAVAVIFSAPIVQIDHRQQALKCALAMDAYALQFSQQQNTQGVQFGITRIGVCTGKVLIGNFGGKTMFDYRALGDPINTASRLEGANKYFGTRVCVSASTLDGCNEFKVRPIGDLILKGKSNLIPTFELLSNEDYAMESTQDYLHAYQKLTQKSLDALTCFQQLVETYPHDRLSSYHYQRLKNQEIGSIIRLKDK